MTSEISFKLYELFIPLVKEEAKAKDIVTNIENIIEHRFENETNRLVNKIDIANLRTEMKEDIANLRTEMKEQKSEIIKWMFLFWVGQIAVTFGFILLYLKHP
ncbi:MAG: hypothetical protein RI955_500 [Bacteroidota bacterium]|jgi:hypothetical protein